ncbi:hypothetical protein R3P38DRAFT_3496330 [Favolaschia claudopus]|uniref:F-box domain-containing protein n=1 Tax=Favolaschia claudopus TaxID=2862362 RepID=A0AAW0C578_9AGAR
MSLVAPNEIWIHIFSFVRDGRSLKSVILTCHRFHDLALPELLQTVVWTSVEKAETHLDLVETQVASRSVPRELVLNLPKDTYTQIDRTTEIVNRMAVFMNLETLSIIYGYLTDSFYDLLAHLPRLTHLSLAPPSHPSHPGPHHIHTLYEYLFAALPHVVALTHTDFHPVSVPHLPRLTSLSIDSLFDTHVVAMLTKHYLPRLHGSLRDLHVNVRKTVPDPHAPAEQLDPVEPSPLLLRSFAGSFYIANRLLRSTTGLSSLRIINRFIKKTKDALGFIEACSALPLEEIELGIEDWDDEVLLAIMHRLPSCQHDFLFHLGIQYLPLLAKLHTLHVYADPVLPPSQPTEHSRRYFGAGEEDREDAKQRAPAVVPEEESCVEYLAVWKKYTPALRRVQFVKGREWKREGERARWFVWNVPGVHHVHEGTVGRLADEDADAD